MFGGLRAGTDGPEKEVRGRVLLYLGRRGELSQGTTHLYQTIEEIFQSSYIENEQ
jgi:hypothetical protein